MWIFQNPISVLALAAITLSTYVSATPVLVEEDSELYNATLLEKRACASGTPCGYYGQLCCASGESCFTNANNEAQCGAVGAPNAVTSGWVYYTTTWVETGLTTRTSVYSSFVGGTQATPTGCPGGQPLCQGTCCPMGYYCQLTGTCALIGGGTSPAGTINPSAPLRPTSSTLIIVTATGSPTATVPFQTPIATGVNGTVPVEQQNGGGGLSGGAIAGIVIGVIAGIILLILICLYCCARALFDTFMALLGLGKKRRGKHTHEETYIEEHHHHSGAAGGSGRWYGSRPSRPAKKKEGGGFGNLLGMGAALGGLALALGLKRRHDRRHDEKSTISGTSASYSYYTSTSESKPPTLWSGQSLTSYLGSASSDDRRTRNTRPSRHSSRR